jgi:hypothetical protein
MTLKYSSRAAKELVLQFVLDSIEQRKKSVYLQEIISMGKKDQMWIHFLNAYFRKPVDHSSWWEFSMN